ncbi:MAG: SoxR reducing system RseC family protein [Bacteroidales bacterium]|nr:SoxR reducing system RseC family protein [Bacteroidales bacterium]
MSDVKECVVHDGIVSKVDAGKVYVNIVSMSACVSCQAKGLCNMSDIQEKLIEAEKPEGKEPRPGDHVTLEMEESLGSKAVLLGYFYPFLLVLGALIVLTSSGIDEGISGLISLMLLVPYYLILYFSKDKLRKNFAFRIR